MVTKIRRFCNFLLRIGKTGQTRFGAGITHSNGSIVTHFPKYRQYGVRTAHTPFLRFEQFPMLGALGGCSKNSFFPNHADWKTLTIQSWTCINSSWALQTSVHKHVEVITSCLCLDWMLFERKTVDTDGQCCPDQEHQGVHVDFGEFLALKGSTGAPRGARGKNTS